METAQYKFVIYYYINIIKLNITSQQSQLVGGWPVGYLYSMEELN